MQHILYMNLPDGGRPSYTVFDLIEATSFVDYLVLHHDTSMMDYGGILWYQQRACRSMTLNAHSNEFVFVMQ